MPHAVLLILVGWCMGLSVLHAQDIIFAQPYEQLLYLNPAMAGSNESGNISLYHRSQWIALPHSFRFYGLNANLPLELIHGAIGANLLQEDYAGLMSHTQADFIYSYEEVFSHALSVNFAIQTTIVHTGVNTNNLVLPDQIDPATLDHVTGAELLSSQNHWYPDFALGFAGAYNSIFFGSSIYHITRPVLAHPSGGPVHLPIRVTAHLGCNLVLARDLLHKEPLLFSPNLIVWQQGQHFFTQAGSYFILKPLYSGIWIRSDQTFSLNSLILLCGINLGRTKFAFSWDTGLFSPVYMPDSGSWEITCSLKVDQVRKRKKIRAIKCPKI